MNYRNLLRKYEKVAQQKHVEFESIKWLIFEISQLSPTQFYLNIDSKIDTNLLKEIEDKIKLYTDGHIPPQHILGFAYFFGRKFIVSNDVLIPRRETEELVEYILDFYDTYFYGEQVSVVDLGTGSGSIATTLAIEEPNMKLFACDISEKALLVAQKNANNFEVEIDFRISNWFDNFNEKFSIIVANPPYIPSKEEVGLTVDKEPLIALYGGNDGLIYYEEILKNVLKHTCSKVLIAFEHGYQHNDSLDALIKRYLGDVKVIHKKDLQGKDRFTFILIGFNL